MLNIADISVIIAALGVLIGVIQYVLQMRYQTKIMRSDALVRLYSTTNSEDVLESYWVVSNIKVTDYEGYVNQFGSPFSKNEHADIHKAMMKVLGIYDLVGNLLYKKLIDFDLVYTVVGIDSTKALHKSLYPILVGIREESNEPGAYAGFDYLVNELTVHESDLKKDIKQMLNKSKSTL